MSFFHTNAISVVSGTSTGYLYQSRSPFKVQRPRPINDFFSHKRFMVTRKSVVNLTKNLANREYHTVVWHGIPKICEESADKEHHVKIMISTSTRKTCNHKEPCSCPLNKHVEAGHQTSKNTALKSFQERLALQGRTGIKYIDNNGNIKNGVLYPLKERRFFNNKQLERKYTLGKDLKKKQGIDSIIIQKQPAKNPLGSPKEKEHVTVSTSVKPFEYSNYAHVNPKASIKKPNEPNNTLKMAETSKPDTACTPKLRAKHASKSSPMNKPKSTKEPIAQKVHTNPSSLSLKEKPTIAPPITPEDTNLPHD